MAFNRLTLAVIAALATAILAPLEAQAQDVAGTITRLRGDAAAAQAGTSRALALGDPIFVADEITTGADTRLEMRLTDDTVVTLGDDTIVAVAVFTFDATTGRGNGLLRIAGGVFRAVTGRLTKLQGNSFAVATPVATAGIRGTDFWGNQQPDLLSLALLDDGPIVVQNAAGSVVLDARNLITVVTLGQAPTAPVPLTPAQLQAAVGTVSF